MTIVRALWGFGPSKAERIVELEQNLRNESALLDLMAFRNPATFRSVCMEINGSHQFRPGVARLEYIQAKQTINVVRARSDGECLS
jgi:hypothetical protein